MPIQWHWDPHVCAHTDLIHRAHTRTHTTPMHKVKFEGASPVGDKETKNFGSGGEEASMESGPLFPHLYGGIDLAAVAGPPLPMQRDAAGRFMGIDGS